MNHYEVLYIINDTIDDAAKKDIEIQLAPDLHGKKTVGVVGSIIRV